MSRSVAITAPDLEARIHANVDDRDAYLVYGDWLSERGDPRGELITVQAKLDQNPSDTTLRERETAILAPNRDAWLGELAKLDPKLDLGVKWRWGFIDSIRIGPTDGYDTSEILDNWNAFAHLKRIDLSHAYLSENVVEELRGKQGTTIVLEDLQEGGPDDRYCEISE